jgi:hypothetical protein
MVYLFCLIFCVSLFWFAEVQGKLNNRVFILYSIITILFLSLVLGLREGVGGDFYSYYKIFKYKQESSFLETNKEYLFYALSIFLSENNLSPHLGFFIVGFVQIVCLLKFIRNIEIKYISVFFIIYFCFSRAFINSTNGIRQYTAIYICSLTTIYLIKKIYTYVFFLFFVSMFIHRSSILIFPVLLVFSFLSRMNKWQLFFILIGSIAISFINLDSALLGLIRLTSYWRYADSKFFAEDITLVNKITKYIYVPLFFMALLKFKAKTCTAYHTKLFNLGMIAFSIRIIGLSSIILTRITGYFVLLDIFPLHYLITNKKIWDKKFYFFALFIVLSIIVIPQVYKIFVMIDAGGEYGYDYQFDDLVIWYK